MAMNRAINDIMTNVYNQPSSQITAEPFASDQTLQNYATTQSKDYNNLRNMYYMDIQLSTTINNVDKVTIEGITYMKTDDQHMKTTISIGNGNQIKDLIWSFNSETHILSIQTLVIATTNTIKIDDVSYILKYAPSKAVLSPNIMVRYGNSQIFDKSKTISTTTDDDGNFVIGNLHIKSDISSTQQCDALETYYTNTNATQNTKWFTRKTWNGEYPSYGITGPDDDPNGNPSLEFYPFTYNRMTPGQVLAKNGNIYEYYAYQVGDGLMSVKLKFDITDDRR